MNRYEVYRNRAFIGTVKAVSLRQALQTARRRHGRCEVIGLMAAPEKVSQYADCARTEGRAPCNQSAAAKARIEAIRLAAIAEYATSY